MKLVSPPLPKSPVPRSLLDDADTLVGTLTELTQQFPDFECLAVLDRHGHEDRVSLGALWKRAQIIETHLLSLGLGLGEFVLLALPTSAELLSAYFGVMLAGGVPGLIATPSNRVADLSIYASRIGMILRDANARALYCGEEIAELFLGRGEDLLSKALLVSPSRVTGSSGTGSTRRPSPQDIATVQYSSGSTGVPKGILLTHEAMLNNIRAVRDGLGLTANDVSVNWIPLYHDMGLIDAFLLPLFTGCASVLTPTTDFLRNPALWLWAIHHYRGAISWAPNFAYTICAKRVPERELEGLDLSSWRMAINAAEPVLESTIHSFTERFRRYGFQPQAMTPAWGLAENVTIATAHPVEKPPIVETIDRQALAVQGVASRTTNGGLSSVAIGTNLPHVEIQCRDDAGHVLPDRYIGAVWMRTNSLFSGYNGNPDLTNEVLIDGWLNTGDRGYLSEGNLFFVSRDKDLIIIGGEKYAPHDVETAINQIPGVREGCAVAFGVLNEERGTEDVAAVVETRVSGEPELGQLREAIRSEVAGSTGIGLRYVILVPPGGIEKTTSGKLARRATRTRYEDRLCD